MLVLLHQQEHRLSLHLEEWVLQHHAEQLLHHQQRRKSDGFQYATTATEEDISDHGVVNTL